MVVEPLLAVGVDPGEDGRSGVAHRSDLNQAEPPGAPEDGLSTVPGLGNGIEG